MDCEARAGDSSVSGYMLGGELKDFSTEARFTNSAHISALIRLYTPNGTVAVEKEISHRVQSQYGGGGVLTSIDELQRIMNEALAQFVQRVVTDPRLHGATQRDRAMNLLRDYPQGSWVRRVRR
jgi:hypothetical protein